MSFAIIIALSYNALVFLLPRISASSLAKEFSQAPLAIALGFTLQQAVVSGLFSVALGFAAAPGYATLGRSRRWWRWIFLMPNMMSSVLAVLAMLLVFPQFPFGFWGIILGHVFINCGLCTVWLGEAYREIGARHELSARALGADGWLKFTKVILPEFWPQVKMCFAVTTALCLTSFAIPLVLGGGPQSSTLEVLLFERLHAYADIPGATTIAFVQCLLQAAVFLFVVQPSLSKAEYRRNTPLLPRKSPWFIITLFVAIVSAVPVIEIFSTGLRSVSDLAGLFNGGGLSEAIIYSLVTATAVGFVTFGVLILVTALGYTEKVLALPTLSGVVVGLGIALGFLPLGLRHAGVFIAALICGHIAVIFVPVFRLTSASLRSIHLKIAPPLQSLGGSTALNLRHVYLPLTARIAAAGAVLAGCWSMGEFSVSSLVTHGAMTLPLFIQSLLGSYRLELASAGSIILLLLSLLAMTALEVLAIGLV